VGINVCIYLFLFAQLLYSFIIFKQFFCLFVVSETENSQANFGVERVEGGHSGDHDGGNVDGFIRKMINWLEDRGILGGERRREARRKGRGGNEGSWGGETEYSWGRGQNYGHGGVWEGDVHEREENEEPGLG